MARKLTDIAAEGILLLGGGRAILLQVANPAIGHGVAAHSDFSNRPLDRLHATMTYVYAVIYGTPAQRVEVRRRVDRAHAPVQRAAAVDTLGYSAFDPELQLWVVATLYDTAVTVYQRIYGPLDDASAEQIYQDYAVLGTALQLPAGSWPKDRAAFCAYWNDRLASLQVDAVARDVAYKLLHPVRAPLWLRLAMPAARLMTAGFLPEPVRQGLDLPWTSRRQWWFDRLLRGCSVIYPPLPRKLRHSMKDRYLAQL